MEDPENSWMQRPLPVGIAEESAVLFTNYFCSCTFLHLLTNELPSHVGTMRCALFTPILTNTNKQLTEIKVRLKFTDRNQSEKRARGGEGGSTNPSSSPAASQQGEGADSGSQLITPSFCFCATFLVPEDAPVAPGPAPEARVGSKESQKASMASV